MSDKQLKFSSLTLYLITKLTHKWFDIIEAIESKKYAYELKEPKVGDWAIERSSPQLQISGLIKIKEINGNKFLGEDVFGQDCSWENAGFIRLPDFIQDTLNKLTPIASKIK